MWSVPSPLPIGIFGPLRRPVTRLGLGGEGVLRTFGRETEARLLIETALEEGISYFESARAYSGSEAYLGRALRPHRAWLFLASKAHDRTKAGARAMLERSLQALQTDYLDLWQFHDVREQSEVDSLSDPGGAFAAFVEAKERGDVRAIGVTGHYDPAILRAAFEAVPFDAVLLPINPAEGALPDGFEQTVVPAARARNMAVVGMKVFSAGALFARSAPTHEQALHYALAADVDVVVVGCGEPGHVRSAAAAARSYRGLDRAQRAELEHRAQPATADLTFYREPAAERAG